MTQNIVIRRGWAVAALLVAAAGLLTACASSDSTQSSAPSTPAVARSYVGTATGTEAFVSVVVDGSRALAYVCDGIPADPTGTTPSIQAWFNGPSDGRTVDLQEPSGRLQLQLGGTDMTGTLKLSDGRTLSVNGRAADGDAGLYRAETSGADASAIGGWILAADGEQRGGVGGEEGASKTLSGVRVLNLSQPTFSVQGLASARIGKVGITPIPIP